MPDQNPMAVYRRRLSRTQEQVAHELGLKSKASICGIENGEPPSLELAIRIEVWSGGEVPAAELRPDLAEQITAWRALTPAESATAHAEACA